MYNVMEIGELKAQLTKQKQATENCEAMLSRMVEERNTAIAREEEAKSAHRHEITRMKAKLTKSKYTKSVQEDGGHCHCTEGRRMAAGGSATAGEARVGASSGHRQRHGDAVP